MNPSQPYDSAIEAKAAEWLARCDRGLTAEEQDAYLAWLSADPRHAQAVASLAAAWSRLDQLEAIRPDHLGAPNADLFASGPRRPRARVLRFAVPAAAAVLVALGWFAWSGRAPSEPAGIHQVRELPGPERLALPDGSFVELNTGAQVASDFSDAERRVVLTRGEAFFSVQRDAARPFVVEAGAVTVRALGTAFSVDSGGGRVAVLVTEGAVSLAASDGANHDATTRRSATLIERLVAGQRAVAGDGAAREFQVETPGPAEIDAALAWRGPRLEFDACPLREVVAAFNRVHARTVVIGDPEIAELAIGGTLRADNLDAFVRLLEAGFGIEADVRGDEIVLRRRADD